MYSSFCTFQTFLLQLQPLGCNLVNVPSDQHGIIPAALKEVLSRWDPSEIHKPGSSAPKILYTIPNGGNPTGASMTTQRKKEVYEVALHLFTCKVTKHGPIRLMQRSSFFVSNSWLGSMTCSSSRTTRTTSCSLTRYINTSVDSSVVTLRCDNHELVSNY